MNLITESLVKRGIHFTLLSSERLDSGCHRRDVALKRATERFLDAGVLILDMTLPIKLRVKTGNIFCRFVGGRQQLTNRPRKDLDTLYSG